MSKSTETKKPNKPLRKMERIAYELYQESAKMSDKGKKNFCEVYLGDIEEPQEVENSLAALAQLKNENIIKSFSAPISKTIKNESVEEIDAPEFEDSADSFDFYNIAVSGCEYNLDRVRDYLKKTWKQNKEKIGEIKENYRNLIIITQAYLNSKNELSEKPNETYKMLVEKILKDSNELNEISNWNIFPDFELSFQNPLPPKIPFSSLFTARQEMRERKLFKNDILEITKSEFNKLQNLSRLFGLIEKSEFTREEMRKILETLGTRKNFARGKFELYEPDAKPVNTFNDLSYYSDGTIRFKGNIIDMRKQINDLCRLFIDNPNRLLNIDDIKDAIISEDKIPLTSNSTIAKYVSELNTTLNKQASGFLFYNQRDIGWIFSVKNKAV